MPELFVICALCALAMAMSLSAARWLIARPAGSDDLSEVARRIAGGAARYLGRHHTIALSLAAVFAAGLLLSYGVAYQARGPLALSEVARRGPSFRQYGVVVTLLFLIGGMSAWLAAGLGAWTSRHAAARAAEGARRSLDEALQISLRAGGVAAIGSQAIACLAPALAFFALSGYLGNWSALRAGAMDQAARVPLLLCGLGLGAAFVSLLGQVGGGIFASVADLGADVVGKLEASLVDDAAGNPATLADLAGDQVGDGAARAAGFTAAAICATIAAMMVAAIAYRDNPALPSAAAMVLFPLVLRAFGLGAAWCGVLVVRTDDTEALMSALSRGAYVATALNLVAALGCAKWLLGDRWLQLGCAAATGVIAGLALAAVARYFSEQRHGPVRALADIARAGASLSALRGLLVAADGTLAIAVTAAVAALTAGRLGAATGLSGGGALGLAFGVVGLSSTTPYLLATDAMGTTADSASGVLACALGSERPDVHARARLLGAAGTSAKGVTSIVHGVASSAAAVLLVVVFLDEARHRGAGTFAWGDFAKPPLIAGAALGLMAMIAFGRVLLGRILGAGRDLVHEIRRQIGPGAADAPPSGARTAEDASGSCVEAVSRAALRGMLPPVLVGVGLPLAIGIGLRLAVSRDRVASAAEALAAFALVATIAAGLGSLLFTNAGSAWDNAKRTIETGAHGGRYLRGRAPAEPSSRLEPHVNPTYVAAVIGDTIGDPLKGAVGPAMLALIETLACLALVFLPLLV